MGTKKIWKWVNLCAFLCMVLVNILAEVIPIGGRTTGEISALYPSPLTPAPISFSIWGVIYGWLGVFLIMQLVSRKEWEATDSIGPWFLMSCLANIGWLIAWHMDMMTTSIIFMVVLLITLIMMEGRLRYTDKGWRDQLLVRGPFGLYFGWITVATIANVSIWLMSLGFNGFGWSSTLWQVIVLLIGGVILSAGVVRNKDWVYGAAGIWGYAGILMKQNMTGTGIEGSVWVIVAIVIAMAAIVVACVCGGRCKIRG